jgi:predicted O-methyltransferase YrrM
MLKRLIRGVTRRLRLPRPKPGHVPSEQWRASCFSKMRPLPRTLYDWMVAHAGDGREPISMLHVETLMGLYYFTRASRGMILEVGPYMGGSTVVLAKALESANAARQPGERFRRLIAVEKGGAYLEHPIMPSSNILADLDSNLRRHDVQDQVEVVHGWSYDPHVVSAVAKAAREQPIGLMVFDANGQQLMADFERYRPYCDPSCYLVFDDYIEGTGEIKSVFVKPAVDQLLRQGRVETLGVLPWGTWFGRMVPRSGSGP